MGAKNRTTEVTFLFTPEGAERMEKLKKLTNQDEVGITKEALRLYEAVAQANARGASFLIDKNDGSGPQPYEIFAREEG